MIIPYRAFGLPAIITTALGFATQGAPYSSTLLGTGGFSPYTWSATGLPTGLSVNASTGALTGTPTAIGSFAVSVLMTDSLGKFITAVIPLLVVSSNAPAVTSAATLPGATAGTAYSFTFKAAGGLAPYTWSIISGSFVSGLALSGAVVSGAPATAETDSLVIQVKDANGNVSTQNCSLITVAAASIPPGAQAAGFTSNILMYQPKKADVSFVTTNATSPLYWALYYNVYKTYPQSLLTDSADGHLQLNYLGDNVGATVCVGNPNKTAGGIPFINNAKGFYCEFTVIASVNASDIFDAVWLLPLEHSTGNDKPAASPGYEAWPEFDVNESGFAKGPQGTALDWFGAYGHTLTFTAPPSGTSGNTTVAMAGFSGVYPITFSDGETKSATMTQGSTLVSWTGALTGTPTVTVTTNYGKITYNNNGKTAAVDTTQLHKYGIAVDFIGMTAKFYNDSVLVYTRDLSNFASASIMANFNYYPIVDIGSHISGGTPHWFQVNQIEAWVSP